MRTVNGGRTVTADLTVLCEVTLKVDSDSQIMIPHLTHANSQVFKQTDSAIIKLYKFKIFKSCRLRKQNLSPTPTFFG